MNVPLSGQLAPQSASSPLSPESAALEFLETLKTPCRLLIACSGGGDSIGLLVALANGLDANPRLDISLVAATVDHGLRAGSADEARLTGALCERFSIPHHILGWVGDKPKTGIQAAARDARYRLLGELARSIRADLIVTAHTLDDQIETIAMRRARNPEAGGMSRAVLYDREKWIVRPFLAVRGAAIRQGLKARGIGWIDDPSNDNVAFERVRIRKSLPEHASLPDLPDFRELHCRAAQFLLSRATVHSARVAVLHLAGIPPADLACLLAVRHLAAWLGGRSHLGGRETTDRIARFLALQKDMRLTAERVVLDRRKDKLYITREWRSLPEMTIEPRSSALWDNRFRIANQGFEPAVVAARSFDPAARALLAGPLPLHLPGSVRQRVEATGPVLRRGRLEDLMTQPLIAQFDRFLPLDLLEIANALAFLGGLVHFQYLPTR